MNDDARALLGRLVADRLRANPIEGVTLDVRGVEPDAESGGVRLRLGIDAPMRSVDPRVPAAVNAAISAALRAEPSLRGVVIDVQVDAAG